MNIPSNYFLAGDVSGLFCFLRIRKRRMYFTLTSHLTFRFVVVVPDCLRLSFRMTRFTGVAILVAAACFACVEAQFYKVSTETELTSSSRRNVFFFFFFCIMTCRVSCHRTPTPLLSCRSFIFLVLTHRVRPLFIDSLDPSSRIFPLHPPPSLRTRAQPGDRLPLSVINETFDVSIASLFPHPTLVTP